MISVSQLTTASLANLFDHTQLHADARRADFEKLCAESREYGFKMVAINPAPVALCKELLVGTPVHVGAAIGFPLGQNGVESKVFETQQAIRDGADEIDYVINIGAAKDGDFALIRDEMRRIVDVCRQAGVLSKVIFENCYLTKNEIRTLAQIAREERPDFIKTSTGKQQPAATPEAAYVMCEAIKEYYQKTGIKIGFKPAGGINTVNDAIIYYTIVKELLGEEWLDNQLFRLGTSRLANLLLSDIKGEEIKFF